MDKLPKSHALAYITKSLKPPESLTRMPTMATIQIPCCYFLTVKLDPDNSNCSLSALEDYGVYFTTHWGEEQKLI
jgi:hypothetical protein